MTIEVDNCKQLDNAVDKPFCVEILKIIKEAQQQHGLRHGDYQRYRGYCSRRIRRLRKVSKITQGEKRHFKKKEITAIVLSDARYFYIPLMLAERAWSYAMQLRQEANTETRKRFHLIQRLRKATVHALQLEELCESGAFDARTKLEVQAYTAWIHACLHCELHMWKAAMKNLEKAQVVYHKLAETLQKDEKTLYESRVEELSPSVRFCAYNIGDGTDLDLLLTIRTQGQGEFLHNLDSLLEKTKTVPQASSEIEWRGHKIPVRPERVRLYLLADKELDSAIRKAGNITYKIELLENNLMDCKDAISCVKEEIKSEVKSANETYKDSLQLMILYLKYKRLSRTMERNRLMIEQLKIEATEKTKLPRSKDITRLCDTLLQNLNEIQHLKGMEKDIEFQGEVNNKIKVYKAFRCFYIAEYLVNQEKWKESMSMYQKAKHYISETSDIPQDLEEELMKLQHDIESSNCSAHAHSVIESSSTKDVAVSKRNIADKPLLNRLDEYLEDCSLLTKTPNVVRLPPDMIPVPCKPIFLDLAFNYVTFPSLEHKIETKKQNPGLADFVKGLWGWGSKN